MARAHAAHITPEQARTLFLAGHGMCADPARRSASRAAHALDTMRALGFVQVDSINVVERAHHHILWARDHAYRPSHLEALQRRGEVFEHWTHDASIIPIEWFPHWRHRFERVAWSNWFHSQLGETKDTLLESVRSRIEREGPLMARDFEAPAGARAGAWWEWKPAKAALEYLWRRGELAIVKREGFQKVYDLTSRALPGAHARPAPDFAAHADWACAGALERIGVGTPTEIARFWNTLTIAQARAWCAGAPARGLAEAVVVEGEGGARAAFARPDWREALARAGEPHAGARLLSPFDPLVRDRARALRLFGFDYRFEAFTPAHRRAHGYYVLPILDGNRFIGRLDPALDRAEGVLKIRGLWWEKGVRAKDARARLAPALDRYAAFVGASRWELPARARA